jgi:hypothetical protein
MSQLGDGDPAGRGRLANNRLQWPALRAAPDAERWTAGKVST